MEFGRLLTTHPRCVHTAFSPKRSILPSSVTAANKRYKADTRLVSVQDIIIEDLGLIHEPMSASELSGHIAWPINDFRVSKTLSKFALKENLLQSLSKSKGAPEFQSGGDKCPFLGTKAFFIFGAKLN